MYLLYLYLETRENRRKPLVEIIHIEICETIYNVPRNNALRCEERENILVQDYFAILYFLYTHYK